MCYGARLLERHGLFVASAMVIGLFMNAARDLSAEGIESPFLDALKDAIKRAEELIAEQRQNRTMQ